MKNKIVSALILVIGAILLIIGPKTIFKVCDATEKQMKCYWTTRAEIGIAIVLVAAAILTVLAKEAKELQAISKLTIAINLVGILLPAVLIGGCSNKMMACQTTTFPAFYLIHGVLIVWNLFVIIHSYRKAEQ